MYIVIRTSDSLLHYCARDHVYPNPSMNLRNLVRLQSRMHNQALPRSLKRDNFDFETQI